MNMLRALMAVTVLTALLVLPASAAPKFITQGGDLILQSDGDLGATVKVQKRSEDGVESKDLWEMANKEEVQSSVQSAMDSIDMLNATMRRSIADVETNQSALRVELQQSLSLGVEIVNTTLTSSMNVIDQRVEFLSSQASADNFTLTNILTCNRRGLVYDNATNTCTVAAGAIQQLANLTELTAMYENGQTGLFYVRNNSISSNYLFFSPEPSQLIRFHGTSVTPASWTPPPTFGSGADGDFSTSRSTQWSQSNEASLTTSASSGDFQLSVSRALNLAPGDKALIISLVTPGDAGPTNGTYELVDIDSVTGFSVTIRFPLENSYPVLPGTVVRVQKVPQYRNVRINHRLSATDWNGQFGGIIAFMASDTVTVNNTVFASGSGFRGGWSQNRHGTAGEGIAGYQSSYTTNSYRNNGGGGGGGRACSWSRCGYWCGDAIAGGGGGGGHASAGSRPGSRSTNCHSFTAGNPSGAQCLWPEAGGALGNSQMSKMHFGGGGGARGGEWNCNQYGRAGNGGGIVLIIANNTRVNANIIANGDAGSNPYCHDAGGSGGGAGGSIFLRTDNLHMTGSNKLRATGGGGVSAGNWCNQNARGGNGSPGRIRVDFNTFNSVARNNPVAQLGARRVADPPVAFSASV